MKRNILNIYIGWDPHEVAAFHTLCHSILTHASKPVSITPLKQDQLRTAGLYTRTRNPMESTEFSFTRFLVPYLSGYGDYSLFLDCDMLVTGDVWDLLALAKQDKEERAVWVVQHDYTPSTTTKFLNQTQTVYPRKNWSSVMLFRNKYCEMLTPSVVNTQSGEYLHQFQWIGQHAIGSLPKEWNWLVEEYPKNPNAKLYHWTIGGPWFRDYQYSDHADLWFRAYADSTPSLNVPKPSGK